MSKDKRKRESRKPKMEQFYAADNILVQVRGKLTKERRDAIEQAAQRLEQGFGDVAPRR